MNISPELARIVAHICADGYIRIGKQRRTEAELKAHPRKNLVRNKYYLRYVNTEPTLSKEFIKDVKKEFNRVVIKLRKFEYEISGKKQFDIVTNLGAGKSRNWFIHKDIFNSSKHVKCQWLKAFFDDEAYVSRANKRIELTIVNKIGLKQIEMLLIDLGINSKLLGPYRNKYNKKIIRSYRLCIYKDSICKYNKLINFSHPKKRRHLQELLVSLKERYGDVGTSSQRPNF